MRSVPALLFLSVVLPAVLCALGAPAQAQDEAKAISQFKKPFQSRLRNKEGDFKPVSEHEMPPDITVRRERELTNGVVRVRELVTSKAKGVIRDGRYCSRVYKEPELMALLSRAGLKGEAARRGFSGQSKKGDYGLIGNRWMVVAVKS